MPIVLINPAGARLSREVIGVGALVVTESITVWIESLAGELCPVCPQQAVKTNAAVMMIVFLISRN